MRRDTSVFSPNVGKCGEIADQNNLEFVHILHSVFFREYRGILKACVFKNIYEYMFMKGTHLVRITIFELKSEQYTKTSRRVVSTFD